MAFGQLTHRESLSDTIVCLRANAGKLYHLGIGQAIAKSCLSKANDNRDCRIFSEMAVILIEEAKSLYLKDSDLEVDLKNNVFAIDAAVIDLCLSAFSWARPCACRAYFLSVALYFCRGLQSGCISNEINCPALFISIIQHSAKTSLSMTLAL